MTRYSHVFSLLFLLWCGVNTCYSQNTVERLDSIISNTRKSFYEYDGHGNKIHQSDYVFSGNQWTLVTDFKFEYAENNSYSLYAKYVPTQEYQLNSVYENGLLTLNIDWFNDECVEYKYDAQSNITEKIIYKYNSGDLLPRNKILYDYDDNCLKQEITQSYQNGQWLETVNRTFDKDGHEILQVGYGYNDGGLGTSVKVQHTYDRKGNWIAIKYYNAYEGDNWILTDSTERLIRYDDEDRIAEIYTERMNSSATKEVYSYNNEEALGGYIVYWYNELSMQNPYQKDVYYLCPLKKGEPHYNLNIFSTYDFGATWFNTDNTFEYFVIENQGDSGIEERISYYHKNGTFVMATVTAYEYDTDGELVSVTDKVSNGNYWNGEAGELEIKRTTQYIRDKSYLGQEIVGNEKDSKSKILYVVEKDGNDQETNKTIYYYSQVKDGQNTLTLLHEDNLTDVIYNLNGSAQPELTKGFNILQKNNGKKIFVK